MDERSPTGRPAEIKDAVRKPREDRRPEMSLVAEGGTDFVCEDKSAKWRVRRALTGAKFNTQMMEMFLQEPVWEGVRR